MEFQDFNKTKTKTKFVVLVHGFNACAREMFTIEEKLQSQGYLTLALDLPTTFQRVHKCTEILENKISEHLKLSHLEWKDVQLYFVGHSMGGLIIKNFWARNYMVTPGNNVLIATPHKGTRLANIMCKIPLLTRLYKPLLDLRSPGMETKLSHQYNQLEFGVIAGTKSNKLIDFILAEVNDGRVPVSSTIFDHMNEMTKLHIGHKKIHRTDKTAKLVVKYLKTSTFD